MPQHGPNILPTCALQRPNIEHMVRKSSQAFFNLATQILFGSCKLVPRMPSTSSAWKFCCAAFSLSDKTRLLRLLVTGGKTLYDTYVVQCCTSGCSMWFPAQHFQPKLPIAWWTPPMQRTPQRMKQKTEGPRILKTSRTWFEDISRTLTNSRPKQSHREPNESRRAGNPWKAHSESVILSLFFQNCLCHSSANTCRHTWD